MNEFLFSCIQSLAENRPAIRNIMSLNQDSWKEIKTTRKIDKKSLNVKHKAMKNLHFIDWCLSQKNRKTFNDGYSRFKKQWWSWGHVRVVG